MPTLTPIEVDENAIRALKQVSTGANIHDSNELIMLYRNACTLGNQARADLYWKRMYERAIAIQKGTI